MKSQTRKEPCNPQHTQSHFNLRPFSLSKPLSFFDSKHIQENLSENAQKENHTQRGASQKTYQIDIREYKPPKTSSELKTPSIIVNLLPGDSASENTNNKELSSNNNNNKMQGSSSLYSYSVKNKYPKIEAFSISKSPITVQTFSTKGSSKINIQGASPSQRAFTTNDQTKGVITMASPTAQSVCSSPRAWKNQTETARVPIFPSKVNSLTDKNLKRSASENKIIPEAAISARSENPFKFADETPNKPVIPRPTRKPKTAQKTNLTKDRETSLKKNTHQEQTPRKIQGIQTPRSLLNSAQNISKQKKEPGTPLNSQMKTPKEESKENKTPTSLKTAKSLTSLSKNNSVETNNKGITPNKGSTRKPPTAALKEIFLNCKSEADLDKDTRSNTELCSPITKRKRSSLMNLDTEKETEREKPVLGSCEDVRSFKTTYFQPIEDFKLNEFIQNVKSNQNGSTRSQQKVALSYREIGTDMINSKSSRQEKPPLSISSFTTVIPSPTIMSERNNHMINGYNNNIKSIESLVEEKPLRQVNENKIESMPSLEIKVSKIESNSKERIQRSNSRDQLVNRKLGKFNDSKRDNQQKENMLKSTRFRSGDNLSSASESLSVSKTSKISLIARVYKDKLSPKGAIANQENDLNTYSKLDQLLKNFKGEKIEKESVKENSTQEVKNIKDGLFAPDFGEEDEAPISLSNLKKSLARILIARNENYREEGL